MKEKKRIRSMTGVTLGLSLLALLIWGLSMLCLTALAREEARRQIWDLRESRMEALSAPMRWYYEGEGEPDPALLEQRMLESIQRAEAMDTMDLYVPTLGPGDGKGFIAELLRDDAPTQTSVVFLDGEGNVLHGPGDYLWFRYASEEEWSQGREGEARSFGWIDMSRDEEFPLFRTKYSGTHSLWNIRGLRLTGRFEGTEFFPSTIAYVNESMVSRALDILHPNEDSYSYTLSELDKKGLLDWVTCLDGPVGEEDVTIYALRPEAVFQKEGRPMDFQGDQYESLDHFMESAVVPFYREKRSEPSWSISGYLEWSDNEVVLCDDMRFYLRNTDFSREENVEPELVILTAVECRPLSAAVYRLRNIYILTGLITLIAVLVLRQSLKKHLVRPLTQVVEGMADDWRHIPEYREDPPRWREVHDLLERYYLEQQYRRLDKNEIQRLNTALDYAKSAEEKRKQQTSAVAHELKTPLAVIHSYAEGLRERIAEDKRDKYLDTILGETERMDAMVLEMLDLSRLEAGRVKLSQDSFSLGELVKSTVERLALAIEGKALQVELSFPEDTTILADEARIGQVVENFLSNAVKYTAPGGEISVRVLRRGSKTTFSVENPCDPIEAEKLSRIWDAYYRTDESRTAPGTGLGLTIAKTIVELHGGSCTAYNTKNGVVFSFTL